LNVVNSANLVRKKKTKDKMKAVKPLSHQTAMPQRLYSVLNPCQHAMDSPRNTPKIITFACNSVYTTSSQRPYSVHTTFPQRLYNVHDVFTARKQLLQRVHGAHTARTAFSRRTQRPHGDYSVYDFFYFFILSNPFLQTYFYFSKQFLIGFNSC